MKIKTAILLLCLATASLIADDNILEYIKASSDGTNINIEWRSTDESSVNRYEIERSGSGGSFVYITSLDTKGNYYTYKFEDKDAFAKDGNTGTQSKSIFTYRIKILKKDNSYSYSGNATVTHKVSGIRRTWGMIKEMFR